MAVLTDKQESFVRPIGITGMSTHRASLACIVCVYLDSHALMQKSLVGNHALQLREGPFGVGRIGFPLLLRGFLAPFALCPFTDICQAFQADETVWVLIYDACRDDMIGVLLQPSLSSANHDKSSCGRASAFLLKTLPQSAVMVCLGNNGFPRMESTIPFRGRGHSQVAYPDIDTNHTGMSLWRWIGYLKFQGYQQIEVLLGFVIPQLGSTNMGILLYQGNVLGIRRIGKDDTPLQGQDADSLLCLETVVMTQLVRQRWGDVLRRLVKPFVPLLGYPCFALCGVLLDFGPQRLVGRSDLARNATGHLGGYLEASTYLIVSAILQTNLVAHLAMLKCILADVVQGIAIRKLRLAQCGELL